MSYTEKFSYHLPFPLQHFFCFAWYIPICWAFSGVLLYVVWSLVTKFKSNANLLYSMASNTRNVSPQTKDEYEHKYCMRVTTVFRTLRNIPPEIAQQILSYLLTLRMIESSSETAEVDQSHHSHKKRKKNKYPRNNYTQAWKILYIKDRKIAIRQSMERLKVCLSAYLLLRLLVILVVWYILLSDFAQFRIENGSEYSDWTYYCIFYAQLLFHPEMKLTMFTPMIARNSHLNGRVFFKSQGKKQHWLLYANLYCTFGPFLLSCVPVFFTHSVVGLLIVYITTTLAFIVFGFVFVLLIRFFITLFGRVFCLDQYLALQEEPHIRQHVIFLMVFFAGMSLYYGAIANAFFAMSCMYDGEEWSDCFQYAFTGDYCSSSTKNGGNRSLITVDSYDWRAIVLLFAWVFF